MTRLDWASAPRRYESGVDHGVLYPSEGPGVPWNGLVTVDESHTGGDMASYYFDGIKYLEKQNPKNFQATITAFSAPKEFSQCIGELPVIPGFILTRQPRKQFGFSYRTLIEDGDEYKIHVVYNATASPESRGYSTIDGSAFATSFSWKIDAVPPKVSGFRPSAHFVLDSTKTDLFTLRAIEDILYGTATSDPRLPSVEELVDIVGLWEPKLIVPAVEPQVEAFNTTPHPSFENGQGIWGSWSSANITAVSSSEWSRSGSKSMRIDILTDTATGGVQASYNPVGIADGDVFSWVAYVYVPPESSAVGKTVTVYARGGDGAAYVGSRSVTHILQPGLQVVRGATGPLNPNVEYTNIQFSRSGMSLGAGDYFYVDDLLTFLGPEEYLGEPFSGDTPDDIEYTYEWTGTPHASTSIRKTRPVAYLTPGLGDLTPSRTPGIYRDLPTSRLAETAVGGLYRLE